MFKGKNFDPPTKKNWVHVGLCHESYTEEYINGYKAALTGKPAEDNPHEPSGHERDTTYKDELNYWWYCGWNDGDADIEDYRASTAAQPEGVQSVTPVPV